MFTVTVLGSAAAVPPAGNRNTALFIEAGGFRLLVDCGPEALGQLGDAGFDACAPDALFVTHVHGDHTLGFPMLLLARVSAKCERRLRVFCPSSVAPRLEELCRLVYGDIADRLLEQVELQPLPESAGSSCTLAPGVLLSTHPMEHTVPCLGLRVDHDGRAVVYSSDTSPAAGFAEFAHEAEILFHEATFSAALDPDPRHKGHSTAHEAGVIARNARARRLALLHLHERYAGRQELLVREARESFGGPVEAPPGQTVLVVAPLD